MSQIFDDRKIGKEAAFRGVGEAATAFNKAKGKKIGEGSIEVVGIRRESSANSRRLSDITGYSFYTLGPVYAATKIKFDIVGNYGNLVTLDVPRVLLTLRTSLFTNLGPWNTVLEGLPTGHVRQLVRFMETQTAMDISTNTYWRFEAMQVTMPDPIGVDRMDIVGPADNVTITVFVPTGNRQRRSVDAHINPPATVYTLPPQAHVVMEAKAALSTTKQESIVTI
jgi:hypothetical protein